MSDFPSDPSDAAYAMELDHMLTALRWELDAPNILATHLLDSLIDTLPQYAFRCTQFATRYNALIHSFLPLTRREELLSGEWELRAALILLWRQLHDWVLPGILEFIAASSRLIDCALVGNTSVEVQTDLTRLVYQTSVIASDRCRAAHERVHLMRADWKLNIELLVQFSKYPIPEIELRAPSFFSSFLTTFLAQTPTYTSPEDFDTLIELSTKTRQELVNYYIASEQLVRLFSNLLTKYRGNELGADWAGLLNKADMRERWTRLEGDIHRGKRIVSQAIASLAEL